MEGKKRKSQASSSLGLAFIMRGSRESIWASEWEVLVRDLFAGKADIAALSRVDG